MQCRLTTDLHTYNFIHFSCAHKVVRYLIFINLLKCSLSGWLWQNNCTKMCIKVITKLDPSNACSLNNMNVWKSKSTRFKKTHLKIYHRNKQFDPTKFIDRFKKFRKCEKEYRTEYTKLTNTNWRAIRREKNSELLVLINSLDWLCNTQLLQYQLPVLWP